jgi:hypothetical protein
MMFCVQVSGWSDGSGPATGGAGGAGAGGGAGGAGAGGVGSGGGGGFDDDDHNQQEEDEPQSQQHQLALIHPPFLQAHCTEFNSASVASVNMSPNAAVTQPCAALHM